MGNDDWIGVGDLVALTLTVFHEEVGKRATARAAPPRTTDRYPKR